MGLWHDFQHRVYRGCLRALLVSIRDDDGMTRIVLDLPEPPNMANRRVHWSERDRWKARAWAVACSQSLPFAASPERVIVSANFRLHQLMDEDNLAARLKLVLDCLRQNQAGKVRWRGGLFIARGYFFDDDPAHMELGTVTQEVDRKNRGVTVIVADPIDDVTGWVVDFAHIKSVFEPALSRLDHHYLNDVTGLHNPTCENLARWIWERIEHQLPGLDMVRVFETAKCGCEYRGRR